MRIFRFLGAIFTLLLGLIPIGNIFAESGQLVPASITSFEVTTVDGKQVRDTPLMAGATYVVNFVVEVAAGLKEKIGLTTYLTRPERSDRFWTMSGDYEGIDADTWQPGQSTLFFDAVAGTVQLKVEGTVPEDYLSDASPSGEEIHLSKQMALVELSLESGQVISDISFEVIDSTIEEYRSVLYQKNKLLSDMNADPAYTSLVKSLISISEDEANAGLTDLAIKTLDSVPDSGWVQQRVSTLYQWIVIGALALVSIVVIALFFRARTETGFIKKQADSQAKQLQILSIKASRIGDRGLADGIDQIRKELQRSAGGS